MNDRFPLCMPYMLAMECPYSNDWGNSHNFSVTPHDPGGATMCGIIQAEYNRYRAARGEPMQSVRWLTIHEGWNIYLFDYWQPQAPALPIGMDLSYFDTKVNCGAGGANKILQAALRLPVDGIWGPQTASAVAGISNLAATIEAFCGARARYYRHLRGFVYFGHGWIHRALAIQNDSLSMLQVPQGIRESRPDQSFVWTARAKAYDEGWDGDVT